MEALEMELFGKVLTAEDYAEALVEMMHQRNALRFALERTQYNLRLAVLGKPVRDLAENLAENEAALGREA